MRADPHPMNLQRLTALQEFGIMDTPPETEFSEITDLLADLLEVPVALITFVDNDRQWFKANTGLDFTETPVDQAICAHALLQNDLLEIPDTLEDPRTADNPLCLGPDGVRFYAGQPMVTRAGLPLGSLCVLDRKPRQLSPVQRRLLRVMADQIMRQLELRVALEAQNVLQSEADHRVKNSLQSMSAIVRIYTRTVRDGAALEALGAIQRRIDAVAALHEELQNDDGSASVDSAAYLTRVMNLLQESAPANISFRTRFAPAMLRSDQAANLAMIISEFTANSIKHAFPDGIEGEISVHLDLTETGFFRLECADNGVGQETDDQPRSRTSGIGLSLVSAAAASLGGTDTTELTTDGSRLVLEFHDDRMEDAPTQEPLLSDRK